VSEKLCTSLYKFQVITLLQQLF